ACDDHVSGRLVRSAVRPVLAAGGAADILVRAQDFSFHFCLCSLALDNSEVSIRSADEIRVEDFASARPGKHSRDELHRGGFMIQVLFFLFAALAVGAAINVLVQKHVLYSALSLIVMLTAVSMLFILM